MPRPLRLALIGAALALTACATPLERCIASAERELRTVERLIAETEANIDRGYALESRTDMRTRMVFCDWPGRPEGAPLRMCPINEPVQRRVPVAIDRATEQGKLATLRERRAELAQPTAMEVQRCRAQHGA